MKYARTRENTPDCRSSPRAHLRFLAGTMGVGAVAHDRFLSMTRRHLKATEEAP